MPTDEHRSGYGDEVLLRYRYRDGTMQAALPLRVVRDDDTGLVGWLAAGTAIMYWALEDGRDPRSVPLQERFDQCLSTAPRTWQGPGVLRVMPLGEPFQVLHFWDDSGRFAGWYVNFESVRSRVGDRLDTIDWHLDLWRGPDGSATWKDEDEAQAAVQAGHLDAVDLAAARSTGEGIVANFQRWLETLGDWRGFVPRPEWASPLALPDDWAS